MIEMSRHCRDCQPDMVLVDDQGYRTVPTDCPGVEACGHDVLKLDARIASLCDAFEANKRTLTAVETERDALQAKLAEARRYGERLYAECSGSARQVACVYCGHVFNEGTPASQDAALFDHAKGCEKHPVAALQKKLDAVVGAGDTAHVAWMMFEDDGGRAEYDRLVLAMTAFRFALDAASKAIEMRGEAADSDQPREHNWFHDTCQRCSATRAIPPAPAPAEPVACDHAIAIRVRGRLCHDCGAVREQDGQWPLPAPMAQREAGPSRAALKELFEAAHDWAGEVGYDYDMSRDPDCPDKTRRFTQALARCEREARGQTDEG